MTPQQSLPTPFVSGGTKGKKSELVSLLCKGLYGLTIGFLRFWLVLPANRLFCALSIINFITIIYKIRDWSSERTALADVCEVLCIVWLRKNWFCMSQLMTIVAIGLQKPYAKSESGTNLVLYNVFWRATMLVSTYGIKIPGIYFQSVESTQIRWFSWWLGGRLVCIKADRLKGYCTFS